MLNLNKKIYNRIKSHALSEKPYECCGLLVEKDNELSVFPCSNIAGDKNFNFRISYIDYLKANKIGKIKAYYHSHANEQCENDFTELDKLVSYSHNCPLLLYLLNKDEFKFFDGKPSQYIGRKFEWNTQDCLSLVNDFYLNEYEINLNLSKESRGNNWFLENGYRIDESFSKFNFVEVDSETLQDGDLIGIHYKNGEPVSHLGIYLKENQILHQRTNSYSTVEIYSELYKKLTHYVLRHKDLC